MIRLRYDVQLTIEEISQEMDMPVGTVKLRLSKAIKKIQAYLDEKKPEQQNEKEEDAE